MSRCENSHRIQRVSSSQMSSGQETVQRRVPKRSASHRIITKQNWDSHKVERPPLPISPVREVEDQDHTIGAPHQDKKVARCRDKVRRESADSAPESRLHDADSGCYSESVSGASLGSRPPTAPTVSFSTTAWPCDDLQFYDKLFAKNKANYLNMSPIKNQRSPTVSTPASSDSSRNKPVKRKFSDSCHERVAASSATPSSTSSHSQTLRRGASCDTQPSEVLPKAVDGSDNACWSGNSGYNGKGLYACAMTSSLYFTRRRTRGPIIRTRTPENSR